MDSKQLISYIEEKIDDMSMNNLFFIQAREGKLSKETMLNYLTTLAYYFQYNITSLALARDTSAARQLSDYAYFYNHKIEEEIGHDLWCVDDMGHISNTSGYKPVVSEGCLNFLKYLDEQIKIEPRSYLLHITAVEYQTIYLGPQFVEDLKKCGYGNNQMTAITKHIELDADHSADNLELLESFFAAGLYTDEQIYQRIDTFSEYYNAFFNSLIVDYKHEQQLHI